MIRFLLLLCLFNTAISKNLIYGNVFVNEITSIYDADTFRVNVAHWPALIGERIPVRVNGVDAPEIRAQCPQEREKALRAKLFTVVTLRAAKQIELRNVKRGKYFRIIADVYVDGKSLATLLIAKKLARPYDGNRRRGWCNTLKGNHDELSIKF